MWSVAHHTLPIHVPVETRNQKSPSVAILCPLPELQQRTNGRCCDRSPSCGGFLNFMRKHRTWRRIRLTCSRCTNEDPRCTDALVMFAAFSITFPCRDSGGGVRMEGGHQLGQCYALDKCIFNGCFVACRAKSCTAAVSLEAN